MQSWIVSDEKQGLDFNLNPPLEKRKEGSTILVNRIDKKKKNKERKK